MGTLAGKDQIVGRVAAHVVIGWFAFAGIMILLGGNPYAITLALTVGFFMKEWTENEYQWLEDHIEWDPVIPNKILHRPKRSSMPRFTGLTYGWDKASWLGWVAPTIGNTILAYFWPAIVAMF